MPALFCCILNCESDSVSSKKRKIFYRLPQNVDRKQLWLSQIGDKIKYGTVSSNSRICNAHFATGKPNLDSSHIDHVPTLFPWSSKEERSRSHQAVEHYEARIKELEQKILAKAFLSASSEAVMSQETEVCLNTNSERSPNADLKVDSKAAKNVHPLAAVMNRSYVESGHTVAVSNDLLSYLISSLGHVTSVTNSEVVAEAPLSVNVAVDPINLSQSHNRADEQPCNKEKSIRHDLTIDTLPKTELLEPAVQNGKTSNLRIQSQVLSGQPCTAVTRPGSVDDTNARSCTCTKSSCLKLYCECFATGNLCSSGCTCNNCRNNNSHKEERAKIVSSYLERDPWVFNSKIDNQYFGKKHSKGCNCLKSSCLKNYCECFENKVFCSRLCRCRMCYNNEDHSHQNYQREDAKIYPASHTSDSISVVSENSPKDCRKRKSIDKSADIYEDVSSNDSGNDLGSKRRLLSMDGLRVENELLNSRGVTTMDIPPVLPQEDDFTEEELAMMLKFREQRSVKVESTSPPRESLRMPTAHNSMHDSPPPHDTSPTNIASSSVTSMGTQLDPNILLSLSKSLAVANLGLGGVGLVNSSHPIEATQLSSNDLLSLLVTQQLLVSRQSALPANYSHVIPLNFSHPQNCQPQTNGLSTTVISSPKPAATTSQLDPDYPPSRAKLSTEDYVRRHIEAAERAVRADNMRRDCAGSKRAIAKQKVKVDPISPPPQKACLSVVTNNKQEGSLLLTSQSPAVIKKQEDNCPAVEERTVPTREVSNGHIQEVTPQPASKGHASADGSGVTNGARMRPVQSAKAVPSNPTATRHACVPRPFTRNRVNGWRWRDKYQSLRKSLHDMRVELRVIKVHMRADQSKIRRLESALLYMSNELQD